VDICVIVYHVLKAVQQFISSVQSVERPLGETSGLTLHMQSIWVSGKNVFEVPEVMCSTKSNMEDYDDILYYLY
jgi:hypothetical protein